MFPSPSATTEPVLDEAPATTGNRKAIYAVGGIVAALAVGGVAFFLLTGSGSGADEAWTPPAPQAGAPSTAPSTAPSAGTKTTVVKSVALVGRDPFAPLFVVPAPAASTATTTTTTPATTSPGSSGTTAGSGTTTPAVTLSVSVVDPIKQTATVAVSGKKYAASVGVAFGQYYVLYSVFNDKCVGVLVGDQSVAVCTTNPVSVTP
jgi:hypothetical protein